MVFIQLLQAQEETSKQAWMNITLAHPYNDKLYYELDIEPKVQLEGKEKWKNIDLVPLVEYYPNKWFDLSAEMVLGYTKNSNSYRDYELSPRLGIRLNILGNLRKKMSQIGFFDYKQFNLATLLRYEYRSLFFSHQDTQHQSRLRLRLETKTAFNHKQVTMDDTYYLFADFEQFFDFNDNIKERFHQKSRLRIGPGYTYNEEHRFELLLIYDYTRDTYEANLKEDTVSLDFRYRIHF